MISFGASYAISSLDLQRICVIQPEFYQTGLQCCHSRAMPFYRIFFPEIRLKQLFYFVEIFKSCENFLNCYNNLKSLKRESLSSVLPKTTFCSKSLIRGQLFGKRMTSCRES